MPEESFILRYDGAALDNHTIEVGDLAEALLGLSEFIQEGNRIINEDGVPISVRAKAAEPGCFQIEIFVAQTLLGRAVEILTGQDVTALLNLLAILGFGSGSVAGAIGIIRWLKKRKAKVVSGKRVGELILVTEDGDQVVVTLQEWQVVNNRKARRALHRMVKPLEREGVESLEIMGPRRESLKKITKADVPEFEPPQDSPEQLLTTERETFVNPVNVWFRGDNKWRFSDGEGTFTATMKDADFSERVLRDEVSFQTSDVLKVRLRQHQYRLGDDLKSEYEVVKVLEHKKGPTQMPLLLGEKDEVMNGNE